MPEITISAPGGGTFSAYLAEPQTTPAPAILVIHEIFGVNKVMRDLTDGFASRGYLAICPDLFWRQEPGIQITDQNDQDWQRAFSLYQGFDEANGVADLHATLDHIRNLESCNGQVGTVGHCLGGKLAYLMATRSDAACSVGYYGVGIENALDEAQNIAKPTLLHIAAEDGFCSKDAQAQIDAALSTNPNVTLYTYAGMDHAFARIGGQHYDQTAATLADNRTAAFLTAHLRTSK